MEAAQGTRLSQSVLYMLPNTILKISAKCEEDYIASRATSPKKTGG
jgi:hypothetical protein